MSEAFIRNCSTLGPSRNEPGAGTSFPASSEGGACCLDEKKRVPNAEAEQE